MFRMWDISTAIIAYEETKMNYVLCPNGKPEKGNT